MKHKGILFFSFIIVLVVVVVLFKLRYDEEISTTVSNVVDTEVFLIQKGETVTSISKRLESRRIIKSAFWFDLYTRRNQELALGIQSGEYVVSPNMSVVELVELFQTGSFEIRLTFIEGWRREEFAEYLAENIDMAFAQSFLTLTQGKEGMLFPDTYIVDRDIAPGELVSLMEATFQRKVVDAYAEELSTSSYTLEQVVILASLIERESFLQEDRRLVADIFERRLDQGWTLGVDATIQYAVANEDCFVFEKCDWWKHGLTVQDLEVDSPYNTRVHVGLPPGPIANPGVDAFDAVLHDTNNSYWFYLNSERGETYFAETNEQHVQNIQRYL